MKHNTKPRYELVLDFFRRQIVEDNKWIEGMKIPPERQLQTMLDVSRNTIRKAISIFINEGFLFTEVGRGTFVNSRKHWDRNTTVIKSKLVGLIITDVELDFGKKIINGVEDYLQKRAYSLILCQDHGSIEKTFKYLDTLIDHDVKGVILDPVLTDDFKKNNIRIIEILDKAGIPVVLIDREISGIDKNSIITNNEEISYRAASHILKNGHKKILIIRDITNISNKRFKGVERAFEELDVPFCMSCDIKIQTQHNLNKDTESLTEILKTHTNYSAVFSLSEYCGKVTYRALVQIGKIIPRDLSFITFDHPEDSHFQEGEITYIEQPLIRMGNRAAETIISLIENGSPRNTETSRIVLPSKLVPGKSIIPPEV